MAARYRKVYAHAWTDVRFAALSPAAKLVALYVLTAQSNRVGVFHFSPALASEQTGLSLYVLPAGNVPPNVAGTSAERSGNVAGGFPQTFPEAFAEVCRTLGWQWDERARVVYIPTWWTYQRPENPNVLRAALDDLATVPDSPLVQEFWANDRYLPPNLAAVLAERSPQRTGMVAPNPGGTFPPTLPERMPHQEQEQEQEQKQDTYPTPTPPRSGEGKTPADPPAKRTRRAAANTEADPRFDRFWRAYPRKVKKPTAARAFAKLDPDDTLLTRILAAVDRHKRSAQWLKDGGQFIPHPATWLNDRRWEDEPPEPLTETSSPASPPAPADLAARGLI